MPPKYHDRAARYGCSTLTEASPQPEGEHERRKKTQITLVEGVAMACVQSAPDGPLGFFRYRWPAKRLSVGLRPCKASTHALLDHRAFELSKHAHHAEHGLAGRGSRIEALLV
jgi:hypothetical protein